ncbi:unnamed protein product [Symbiodinium natans]|uniref:Pentatricopeptide repeat-containing protein, chloroplastic n=1 Tax=Symbiodinium natans TaxID=878477 RepID=A0A812HIU1_9DINO|nr:unnamed protein product [Symbiodinium natans]
MSSTLGAAQDRPEFAKSALLVMEELHTSAVQRSTILHNVLLNSCAKATKWRTCLLQLQSFQVAGRGNIVSQSTAIAAEAQVSRWCSSLERLASLGSRRLRPNAIATTAAAHAISEAAWRRAAILLAPEGDLGAQNVRVAAWADGAWAEALAAKAALPDRRLMPDPITISSAIMAAAEGRFWTSTLCFLQELRDLQLQGTTILGNSAITALSRWEKAWALFAEQGADRLERLGACEMGKQWELALRVLTWAHRDGRCRTVTFNAALRACGQCAQWQVALRLIKDMVKASTPCDAITYNTAMAACEKAGQWQATLGLLGMLSSSGGADAFSYATAARACAVAASWEAALALLEVELDSVARGASLEGCSGRWEMAGAVLTRMRQEALPPNVRSYSVALFDGAVPWRFAVSIMRQMSTEALQPTSIASDAAMVACNNCGRMAEAWQLLVESASDRSPSAFLWGLALLGTSEAEVVQEACVRAHAHLAEHSGLGGDEGHEGISCNDLAALWSSASQLAASNEAFQRCMADLSIKQMECFSLEELVTIAWGACSTVGSLETLVAAQWRVLDILPNLLDTRRQSLMLTRQGFHVLGALRPALSLVLVSMAQELT